jgi:hypothetical protein
MILAITAAGCSKSTPESNEGQTGSGAGVTMTVPDGWTSQEVAGVGFVVASEEGDLESDTPSGPRLVATEASGDIPDAMSLLDSAKTENPSVETTPESVTVDGKSGVSVESTVTRGGAALVTRQVIVQVDQGTAYTVTLEAPADQWDANEEMLQDVLNSIQFMK